MTVTEQILLSLIQQSLFNIPASVPDDADWDAVLQEAQEQAVLGLIADHVPQTENDQWQNIGFQIVSYYFRYLHAQDELTALLSAEDISYVILKGAAAAVYYPAPEYRIMGDIDFFVGQDQLERTKAVMTAAGYRLNGSENAEREVEFFKDYYKFEPHCQVSDEDFDIEKFVIKGLDNAVTARIDEYEFKMLPPLSNGLVLLAHMRHHLLAGLGLRQAIDWMMYADKVLNDEFWEAEFKAAAEEVGLDALAVAATRMCQMYLGLSERITWCKDADMDLCSRLLESLLVSGNFGRKQGSGSQIEQVSTAMRRKGLFFYLQYAGENNWELYKKHHWLRPVCWLYQIGRYLNQGLRSGRGKRIKEDIERSKERYDLLKQLKIV